ncbi:glycosyltransferase family 4 protein [Luteimonas sp. MC1572]|uniref:glycosyltransferase family 4 protein n=1 Tax=Luteimonas sp. MC1572 TaxID=2799325 RepID=UPI001F18263F|nr:glycosyltransferase family 4 protein [Luteimonas sp. MC1572]
MMQYVPALRDAGIEVEVSPLLGDSYVEALYGGSVAVGSVARAYASRVRRTRTLANFDVVWLEKEAWPWLPHCVELPLLGRKTRLAVDYDDAVFHRYDMHRLPPVRALLRSKIDAIMRRAQLVTAGNAYLGDRARAAGCARVEQVPTVIDLERYLPSSPRPTTGPVVVGWIGSPSTAGYLQAVSAALLPLQEEGLVRCVAIGARPDQVVGTPFEARAWREDTEVAELHDIDIGIMPLADGPWERGKCGYKLIQYMACGLPVVASPVGVNLDIVQAGENGELAGTTAEWEQVLRRLVADPALRQAMGANGRRCVEGVYSVQAQAPRLVDMFQSLTAGGGQ